MLQIKYTVLTVLFFFFITSEIMRQHDIFRHSLVSLIPTRILLKVTYTLFSFLIWNHNINDRTTLLDI